MKEYEAGKAALEMNAPDTKQAIERVAKVYQKECKHKWSEWEIIEHTGDWFHPHVIQRFCKLCKKIETDED